MNTMSPRRAMVLAAGLGERMRPITLTTPKPLIPIAGRTMLDRAIDALQTHGIEHVIVNAHYLANAIEHHIAARRLAAAPSPPMTVVIEVERLETGGGVVNALSLLGQEPFFVINGDILWCDGQRPTLGELTRAWDAERMDALLLLHPLATAIGYDGPGDFSLADDGRLVRRPPEGSAPFLFAGLQILHPRLFEDAPTSAFSLNVLYNKAIACGRAFGIVHRGGWCHVGTPADIPSAEAFVCAPPLCDTPTS